MTTIDLSLLPSNVPSICVPRVFSNINETRIRKVFDALGMGSIDKIDMIEKTDQKGAKYNRVFIHFNRWNNTGDAGVARERLLSGKEVKIVYDDPWFWKISAYRNSNDNKPVKNEKNHVNKAKPSFVFDEEERKPQPKRQFIHRKPKAQLQDEFGRDLQPKPVVSPLKIPAENNEDGDEDEDNKSPMRMRSRSPDTPPPEYKQQPTNMAKYQDIDAPFKKQVTVEYNNVLPIPKAKKTTRKPKIAVASIEE
jgi:hypothetical protein